MKRLIIITSIISLILIFTGLFLKNLAIDFEVFNLIIDFNITGDQLTGTGVIGLFFFVFPAALCLYSVINSGVSLGQQRYLYKKHGVLGDTQVGSGG